MATIEKGKVQFIEFHQPALESGTYHLKIEQTIKDTQGRIEGEDGKIYDRELTFVVQGERFGPIPPQDIFAVFPPPESLGEHSNALPHITFKRSTLPWERYPGIEDENLPWLILLLFRDSDFEKESDKPKNKTVTLEELFATTTHNSSIKYPTDMEYELGQLETQQVTVIDVKKKYLTDILPTHEDLDFLAHVRLAISDQTVDPGTEFSTILSNRLPESNGTSTVYLISIEGRYSEAGFDYQGATDEDFIRFLSLASWSFSCVDPAQSFTQLLQKLNLNPSTLRLPQSDNPAAEKYLTKGYIPVPHSLRKGSQTFSWYRSPLSTGSNAETYEFPVKASDQLLRYDSEIGMFDISYSAAWQLGRMLMLENQGLAIELFNWKRKNAQALKELENQLINLPLVLPPKPEPEPGTEPTEPIVPLAVIEWFHGLELLQGIPFNYLVPDERLLPSESIRFFQIDSLWVDCLQDGAFSIGRVTNADIADDRKLRSSRGLTRGLEQKISGIIMRSQVVSGWPSLLIDGYDTAVTDLDSIDPTEGEILPLLRLEKLAKDVLICLFEGEVKTLDIHLQPESMHFGLDAPTEESPEWSKNLRDKEGETTDTVIEPIPWQNPEKEVINLTALTELLKTELEIMNGEEQLEPFTSGQFALQMIEGVQKVRFVLNI